MNREYWTVTEFLASGECPYGRDTLYRLLAEGEIPSIRLGNRYVIPKAAWKRWLQSCGGRFMEVAGGRV